MTNYINDLEILKREIALIDLSNVDYGNVYDKISQKVSYNILGSGVTRIVFDIGNGYIVKFQFGTYSHNHKRPNIDEHKQYKQACKDGKHKLFAPAVYISDNGLWLVMKKLVTTISNDRTQANVNKYNHLVREINSNYNNIGDLHKANVMINDKGNAQAIDYGCNEA